MLTPRVCRGLAPIMSEADAWRACVEAAADRSRATRRFPAASVRLFIDGAEEERRDSPLLPAVSDGGFADYAARVLDQTGSTFSFNVSNAHTLAWSLYDRVREALGGFGHGSGARPVYVGLFSASDTMTAVGAHLDLDYDELYQYVIAGHKRAYLWERDELSAEDRHALTNSTRIDAFAARASVIEARAGEVLYWPGSCYHLMQNLDGHGVGLTVGIRSSSVAYARTDLFEVLRERVEEALRGGGDTATRIAAFADLAAAGDVGTQVLARQLATRSASGLNHSPPLFASTITPATPIHARPSSDLYWACGSPVSIVACGGYARCVEVDAQHLDALLRAIPRTPEQAVAAAALCSSVGASADVDALLGVLQILDQIGAICARMIG